MAAIDKMTDSTLASHPTAPAAFIEALLSNPEAAGLHTFQSHERLGDSAMTKRILLCDDEVHILRAAEFKFRRAGFEVRTACNGEEAWTAILESKPDILITDCQMPRLNGLELCRRIHEHESLRGLPILMLTAKGFEMKHAELTQELGISAVVAKPFSPRELLARVEEILNNAVHSVSN